MNIRKEFKTIVLPIIKGLPLTIMLVVIAFVVTRKMMIYTNSIYQAEGAIRIDTKNNSVNANMLFDEQNQGKSSYNFLTEVESFKSKTLIKETLESLQYDISYYRVGDVKTMELYLDAPFEISYASSSPAAFDRPFYLKFIGNGQFLFDTQKTFETAKDTVSFEKIFVHDQLVMTIKPSAKVIAKNPNSLIAGDVFKFVLNTIDGLKKQVNSSNLFIKPIDKEIQVIKIYYQHEVPEKSAEFINALMDTYIASCQKSISEESKVTLAFIDEQLESIGSKLKNAEGRLAGFKAENGIVNARQETDATLKEIMQLDLQKVGYQMQEEELTRLFDFLATGNDLKDFAPNFESLRDAIFRDAYLQAQQYELEKLDLALKYTDDSPEVITMQAKLNNLKTFIHESVKTTLANIIQRREMLESNIEKINESIQTLPNKERQIVVLEREVKLNESMYNLMMEKRMELAISKTAAVVGHQIIDRASLSKTPIWPNKALIYGVAIFFALLLGILLSFLGHFLFATVKTKEDLTELTTPIPLIGTVKKVKKNDQQKLNAFSNLYTNLEILKQKKATSKKGIVVALTSYLPNEGKTFTTINLGKSLASAGKRVLIIDMDVRKPDVHRFLNVHNDLGISAILQKTCKPEAAIVSSGIDNLDVLPAGQINNIFSAIIFSTDSTTFIERFKSYYDYILIDTPPLHLVVDAVPLMHQTDFNLFIVRSRHSKIRKVKMIVPLIEEFKIPNVYTVLNGIKQRRKNYYYQYPEKQKGTSKEAIITS